MEESVRDFDEVSFYDDKNPLQPHHHSISQRQWFLTVEQQRIHFSAYTDKQSLCSCTYVTVLLFTLEKRTEGTASMPLNK